MMTATEYRKAHGELLEEYETKVRKWLAEDGAKDIEKRIPFFRDGVTCPETWFREGNTFRPLFILKEVSLGINTVEELGGYLETWGNPQRFEFVENPFDDVKIGRFPQWKRIARLAKGMEDVHEGADTCDYYKYDLDFKEGGEPYKGDITGYKLYNHQRTANAAYNDIISKIAILEIKKIGAGQTVNSKLSCATKYYSRHIERFCDLLCRQIELIDPTVIVCLGRQSGACISELLTEVKLADKKDRLWIDGHHHTRSSNIDFYYKPLEIYKNHLSNIK